jgi:ankyrin repeat protein
LEQGVDINVRLGVDQWTPFMTASREGQLEGYAQLRQAKTTTIIGLGKRLSKYFSNVWEAGEIL